MNEQKRHVSYQNRHSKRLVTVVNIEIIEGTPDSMTVFVLENGDRWEESAFLRHWQLVEDKDENDIP